MKQLNIFKKNKIIKLLLIVCLLFVFVGCESTKDIDKNKDPININIEMRDYGTISLELYPDIAPVTVSNFVNLVKSGFYDGLTFHRVVDGFMIQGGDPTGTGKGGLNKTIKGEFQANGFNNTLKHERGVISMGRLGNDYNSASCHFFIVHQTYPSLDGNYAAFGKVIKGMEIVDEIVKNTKVEDSYGTVLKENQPIINKIYIVE